MSLQSPRDSRKGLKSFLAVLGVVVLAAAILSPSVAHQTLDHRNLRASKQPVPLTSYNRPEEDFASREEFDDYLEQREDLSELDHTVKVVLEFFFFLSSFCFPL